MKKKFKPEPEEKKVSQEVEEWKNKYLRALADYQNLENRVMSQAETTRQRANKQLLIKLLDILDDIENADKFTSDPGVNLVKNKFVDLLKNEGVMEIEVLGQPYDPYTAEVSEVVAGETENEVVDVVNKGYKLYNEIIRPARVKVSKKIVTN